MVGQKVGPEAGGVGDDMKAERKSDAMVMESASEMSNMVESGDPDDLFSYGDEHEKLKKIMAGKMSASEISSELESGDHDD
eukprot:12079680-Karenia_brevis.AAC.1